MRHRNTNVWLNFTRAVWCIALVISLSETGLAQSSSFDIKNAGAQSLLSVNENGKVRIGLGADTTASISLFGNDGLVAFGTLGSGEALSFGTGARMMWYPQKAAFRAGYVSTTQWDDANIGLYSVAFGASTAASGNSSTAFGIITTASGASSTAMGYGTTASGNYSTAMGFSAAAIGTYSVAMGGSTVANSDYATAMGYNTTASGYNSTAMGASTTASGGTSTATGYNTTASGNYSTAMGNGSTASGEYAVAVGVSNLASGSSSTAMGNNTIASGDLSTAMGWYSAARAHYSTAIGFNAKANHSGSIVIAANNSASTNDSIATGGQEQMILRADNGLYITNTGGQAPFDGAKLINTSSGAYLTAGGTWTNASSRSLKENIANLSLQQALGTLTLLNPVTYNYKADKEEKHVGFIAEEVPDLVSTKDQKGLSPMDIVAVLTKVVQNQQAEIQLLKTKMEALEQSGQR